MYCVCLLKGSGHTHTWAIVIQSNGQTAEKILKRGAWEKKNQIERNPASVVIRNVTLEKKER